MVACVWPFEKFCVASDALQGSPIIIVCLRSGSLSTSHSLVFKNNYISLLLLFFLLYLVLLLVSELAHSVHDFSDMIFHLLGMVGHDVVRCHDGVLLLEPEAIDIHLLIYFDIDCIQLMS